MKIQIRYFAALRDQSGLGHETLETAASTPAEAYASLRAQHGFSLNGNQVRFAVNGHYVDANQPLNEGDELVFIPPVAGG